MASLVTPLQLAEPYRLHCPELGTRDTCCYNLTPFQAQNCRFSPKKKCSNSILTPRGETVSYFSVPQNPEYVVALSLDTTFRTLSHCPALVLLWSRYSRLCSARGTCWGSSPARTGGWTPCRGGGTRGAGRGGDPGGLQGPKRVGEVKKALLNGNRVSKI